MMQANAMNETYRDRERHPVRMGDRTPLTLQEAHRHVSKAAREREADQEWTKHRARVLRDLEEGD